MGTLVFILVQQYCFFKSSIQELQELRDTYQEHVGVLKQVIADTIVQNETNGSTEESKKLKKTLLTYLKQKDSSLDVEDLEEVYRSFSVKPSRPKTKTQKSTQPVISSKNQRRRIFVWPVDKEKFWVSSFFGKRKFDNGRWVFHYGLDMAALKGTPVKAAANGKVVEAGNGNGYGNTILLLHNKFFKTRYAHLNRIRVKSGQNVKRGQIIGTVGATGNVRANGTDASHLHFEVHYKNKQVNPLYYLY